MTRDIVIMTNINFRKNRAGAISKSFEDDFEDNQEHLKDFEEALYDTCIRALEKPRLTAIRLRFTLVVDGIVPPHLCMRVIAAAYEMASNAVEHGFHERSTGQVDVRVTCRRDQGLFLAICDNGWGLPAGSLHEGNGLRLLRRLGPISLWTHLDASGRTRTSACLFIPQYPPPRC